MQYPKAYLEYLIEFHATRDYFECHEIMEEYWKQQQDDGHENLWVAFIQLAVGQYHDRRGNVKGAIKMYLACQMKFRKELEWTLGIHIPTLQAAITARLLACQLMQNYADINLTLEASLEQLCKEQTSKRNLQWQLSSSDVSEEIIHRHTRRDRSEVILAREEALRVKKQARENS